LWIYKNDKNVDESKQFDTNIEELENISIIAINTYLVKEMYDSDHDANIYDDNENDSCDGVENEVIHATNNKAKRMIKELIIYAKSKGFVKSEMDLLSTF